MEKRWVLIQQSDSKQVDDLANLLMSEKKFCSREEKQEFQHTYSIIANLLLQRGIDTFEKAKGFFRPQLSDLHDPFLMKDMDKAVMRILNAVLKGEKILVYGDYDVDGTTAVALVYTFIREFYPNLDFYIPDRYAEGYGISTKGIDHAHKEGFSLVIALDCGIKAVEKIEYAKEKGVDFIICDHHRPGDQLPSAVAVLDPKREDCEYPYKDLSGCGVGFKLIQALAERKSIPFENLEKFLDLVAVSIAADIVNITGENRILAYYGLKRINTKPRAGLETILEYSNVKKNDPHHTGKEIFFSRELTISDLVFLVGPRINAAGRMENARNSVSLLIAKEASEAKKLASHIDHQNTERKNLDTQTTAEALHMISDIIDDEKKATVVYKPDWHKGVVGIVASRLTESYYRPTIVLTKSNGLVCGSARSVKDFDIYDAIDACSDLLEHFGGHKYAAGLSLKEENLGEFIRRFENEVNISITDDMLVPEIEVDSELELNDITPLFYRILRLFAPFGPGNMAPVFKTPNLIGDARLIKDRHLKLEVSSLSNPKTHKGIAFQQGSFYAPIKKGSPFHIVYHIEENEWMGNTSLQLNIKDIQLTSE